MPAILETAEEYPVKDGDTLESIAEAKCKDLGWKILARYNWGTALPKEVQRALRETVGVKTSDLAKPELKDKPEKLALKPDTDLSPKLRIPKVWKKDSIALEKTHIVDVKRTHPANAISILELDKWFVPEQEKCAFKYELEGEGARADKVLLDVFGSHYCACTAWNDGLGTYGSPADLIDEPVYKLDLAAQSEERKEYTLPGDGWKGEATTEKGMLGHKTGTAAKRFINVAFSPYTAHLRYFKADADKKGRLFLEPFWPGWKDEPASPTVTPAVEPAKISLAWTNSDKRDHGVIEVSDATGQRVFFAELNKAQLESGAKTFEWNKKYAGTAINGKLEKEYLDDTPSGPPDTDPNRFVLFSSAPYTYKVTTYKYKVVADSFKVKWEIKDAPKCERGLLQIVDRKGKLVFEKPLAKAKLSGKQEFAWDGKYAADVKNSEDGAEAIPADMPYRVQIQAHSGINVEEGVALAAMHTEVRLYTDPTTKVPLHLAYDPSAAKPSMKLQIGTRNIGDDPAEGSTKWYRLKLAEAGFHPGPVTDDGSADTFYKTALKEFKRSAPADGSVGAPNFTRLRLDGGQDEAENGETVTAIRTLRESDKRGMFGDPDQVAANNDNPNLGDDAVKDRLGDPSKEMIVWVDDRQYYTSGDAAKDDAGNPFTTGNNANIAFGLNNYRGGMSNNDGKVDTDIAAIPRPWIPLEARPRLLSREKELSDEVQDSSVSDEARESMRKCIGPLRIDWTFDEIGIEAPSRAGNYDVNFIRSKYYVAWALWEKKSDVHERADTERETRYFNCSETLGGSRPENAGAYYKEPFGLDKLSLAPWKAVDVAKTESVATVVHDHIRKEQVAKTDLFEKQIGGAGVYFRPSRIAGDGYRVRAEFAFEKFTGYSFPNLQALRDRYVRRPQVHSAALRVWRRSSFRGYMCWGAATGNWGGAFINEFRAHYKAAHVYFVHEGGTAQSFAMGDVYSGAAGATKYKNVCSQNMDDPTLQDVSRMAFDPAYVWPWTTQEDLGYPWPSDVNQELDKYLSTIYDHTWRKFRAALLMSLVKEAERKGYMRGHLMVEFESSPAFKLLRYHCSEPAAHKYWFIFSNARDDRYYDNEACIASGCAGVLEAKEKTTRTHMGLPAVGGALGATWLFWKGENVNRLKVVWVHEVGHHRHLEHSANAPGFNDGLHDSESNAKFTGWGTVKPPPGQNGHPEGPTNVATAQANARKWDRRCIMSYSDCWYGELGCFCGRCLLRNRGWRVTTLGFPGSGKGEL